MKKPFYKVEGLLIFPSSLELYFLLSDPLYGELQMYNRRGRAEVIGDPVVVKF